MSDTQWPPGPWRIEHDSSHHYFIYAQAPHGAQFEVCPARAHGLTEARLIATAPELYRAVELLLSAIDHLAGHLGQGWQSQDAASEGQDACDFAEAALARARGEE